MPANPVWGTKPMEFAAPRTDLETHEVFNQPKPLVDKNLYLMDCALVDAVNREAGEWLHRKMIHLGADLGTGEVMMLGDLANRNPPLLKQFDRFGQRIDQVEFHPSYHQLMDLAFKHGIQDVAYREPGKSPHTGHSAMVAVFSQVEASVMCPINMTYASVPTLQQHRAEGQPWLDKIIGGAYDAPLAQIGQKTGATLGMAMTEKQGGSDVRANTTTARPVSDGGYELTGHKWFCSAPMSDGFLTLAYLDKGLTCFLVPRILPDGTLNKINIMRLKDKLGNKANASSEIEYHGAWAQKLGDPGNGIKTIIDMVHHTRLGTISATLGLMRMSLAQAVNHTIGRSAFQRRLIDQPVMRAVLADLQIEYEAATVLVVHIAALYDSETAEDRAYVRLAVALAKYLLTKRCPNFVYECMECLGGAGYVEEGPMPRLFREAPLNAIWEGSGNVIALDILRTVAKSPAALDVYLSKVNAVVPTLGAEISNLFAGVFPSESSARHIAEKMAITLQATVLQNAPPSESDGFQMQINETARTYGAGTARIDVDAIIERAAHGIA